MAGWLPLHDSTREFNNVVCISLLSIDFCICFVFYNCDGDVVVISSKLFLFSALRSAPKSLLFANAEHLCLSASFYFAFGFAISI